MQLKQLEEVAVEDNKIKKLPKNLSDLGALTKLNVSGNKLRSIDGTLDNRLDNGYIYSAKYYY